MNYNNGDNQRFHVAMHSGKDILVNKNNGCKPVVGLVFFYFLFFLLFPSLILLVNSRCSSLMLNNHLHIHLIISLQNCVNVTFLWG